MTVRLMKDLELRVLEGKSCVMVSGPVVFVCDTDREAVAVKYVVEMLPEVMGFSAAMADEGLSFPAMLIESWKFVSEIVTRYALDDGSTLRESRILDDSIRLAEIAQLEEASGIRRVCRICGCTEDRSCPGPCYWVELDLCSAHLNGKALAA